MFKTVSAFFEILKSVKLSQQSIMKVLFWGFGCKIQTKQPFNKRWHGFGLQIVSNMKI